MMQRLLALWRAHGGIIFACGVAMTLYGTSLIQDAKYSREYGAPVTFEYLGVFIGSGRFIYVFDVVDGEYSGHRHAVEPPDLRRNRRFKTGEQLPGYRRPFIGSFEIDEVFKNRIVRGIGFINMGILTMIFGLFFRKRKRIANKIRARFGTWRYSTLNKAEDF